MRRWIFCLIKLVLHYSNQKKVVSASELLVQVKNGIYLMFQHFDSNSKLDDSKAVFDILRFEKLNEIQSKENF